MIEYQTGQHKHDEWEVMRDSTAELFSVNVSARMNAVANDIAAMAGKTIYGEVDFATFKMRRHPLYADYQKYLANFDYEAYPLDFAGYVEYRA